MSAYLKFFQLEKSPFDTRAQSALVLGTKALRSAFGEIEAGLDDGAPRICVDGKEGLGKTSLARALPKLLGESSRVVLILNPSLPWSTLRSAIVKQLDLAEGNLSRKTLMRARSEGRRLVIVVDQAERISSESLEHLDILLGYKNDDDQQLLHCVLLANLQAAASQHNEQGEQTPLLWWLDKLNTLQLEFQPVPPDGVSSYVIKHLKRAGWKRGQIFTPEALQTIHRLTGGVPREMSDLCERALELAAEEETDCIDAQLVEDVFGEIPLEDLADDEEDVTDTKFIGAKDDHALSNTTTFGGDHAPSEPDASPFGAPTSQLDAPPPSDTPPDPTAEPETGGAEAEAGSAEDHRIDRMPSAGRRVQAPVEAPLSLDSFFGDSLDGGPATKPAAEPEPEPVVAPTASGPLTDHDDDVADDAWSDAAGDAPRSRGWIKWAGIAAGALVVLGGAGFAALSLLGGEAEPPASAPTVVARPKPGPQTSPPPIAGIEAEEPATGEEAIVAPAASAEAADLAAPAGDPLLDLDPLGADPLEIDMTAPAGDLATADAKALDADAPAAAGAPGDAPAAPAPTWEDPAETEVDAPYW